MKLHCRDARGGAGAAAPRHRSPPPPARWPRHPAPPGLALAAWLVLAGCGAAEVPPAADLVRPAGMAVAGLAHDRVFVVNAASATLQVIRLAPEAGAIDLLPGAARYHPARLSVGPTPSHLAASADGRYVWALDAVGGGLRVLDAERMALATGADGQPLAMAVGPPGAAPSALAASPLAGADGVAYRAYVALRGQGAVRVVDLAASGEGALTLVDRGALAVGGAPVGLAAHPTEPLLFVADASAAELVRAELDPAGAAVAVDRVPVGTPAGPIAISADGTVVAVGRPAARDLLLLAAADGSALRHALVAVDADLPLGPRPACLAACGAPASASCGDGAEGTLCALGTGLGDGPDGAYAAVYLGAVPAHAVAVASVAHPLILDAPAGPTAYVDALAVAGLDGAVYTVGLRRQDDGRLAPLLAVEGSGGARLVPDAGSAAAASVLAGCPAAPARARLACVEGVVGSLRRDADGTTVEVAWHGVVAAGAAHIDGAGDVVLTDAQLAAAAIEVGDTVEVVDPVAVAGVPEPEADRLVRLCRAACAAARLDAPQVARRDPDRLVLDPPLPAACRAAAAPLALRVRAGDAYLVAVGGAPPRRVAPGSYVGPDPGPLATAVQFWLRPAPAPADALSGQAPTDPVRFTVVDPVRPRRHGPRDVDGRLATTLPGGMAVAPASAGAPPRILVSYGHRNAVYVAPPSGHAAASRLLGG